MCCWKLKRDGENIYLIEAHIPIYLYDCEVLGCILSLKCKQEDVSFDTYILVILSENSYKI